MVRDILINQIIPQVIYFIITTIFGLVAYYIKQYLNAHKSFIEAEKEEIIQKIGIERYNQDIAIAKQVVLAVEQMGREFDWAGKAKHSKATEIISTKTGLNEDEIYNIIKATVAEFNSDRKYK